jgi:hypothetical protein
MGQQQLLILVIAFMIGTVALIGATQYLDSVDQQNERDIIVVAIHNLITDAIQYQISPPTLGGGGGGKLTGFQPQRNKAITDRYTIIANAYKDNEIFFQGDGSVIGWNETDFVRVQVTYNSDTRKVVIKTIN